MIWGVGVGLGTSYETLLVTAGFAAVVEAAAGIGHPALVVPVGAERVAVLPAEQPYRAPVEALAVALSERLSCSVLASCVFDSDVVWCDVYRDGVFVHGYVSRQEMTAEWFQDADDTFRVRFDGHVYPADHPIPEGPRGHDPAAFACFAVGTPDLDRIGAALRGEVSSDGAVWAEEQHRAIIEALGLPSGPLTDAYRHTDPATFAGAVEVAGAPSQA